MLVHRIDNQGALGESIRQVLTIIGDGGVVVLPTDTVYGLSASAYDDSAVKKVFAIKGRKPDKPLSLIARDIEMVREIALISDRVERFLSQIWPGPVTVVLPKQSDSRLAESLGLIETVAVRVPANDFLQALLARCDYPIVATSANLSGEPDCHNSTEVTRAFRDRVDQPDMIIDGGILPPNPPSTIIDLSGDKPTIVRSGGVDGSELLKKFDSM